MNLSTLAQIVFFGIFAVNVFHPFKVAGVIIGIAAAVIAILLLIPSVKNIFN